MIAFDWWALRSLTRACPTLRLDLMRVVEQHMAEAGHAPERRSATGYLKNPAVACCLPATGQGKMGGAEIESQKAPCCAV